MRANWKFLCMILLIALCFFLNIAIGTIAIPVRDAFGILWGRASVIGLAEYYPEITASTGFNSYGCRCGIGH